MEFISFSKNIPHPEKTNGGEDAFFTNKKSLGVADGVGGWNDVGVDPGIFSREFLFNVEKNIIESNY